MSRGIKSLEVAGPKPFTFKVGKRDELGTIILRITESNGGYTIASEGNRSTWVNGKHVKKVD